MFQESCTNIELIETDFVSCYVSYCVDSVIPVKIVKDFHNSKSWVTKSLKVLLTKKRCAFQEGNLAEFHWVKKERKIEMMKAKQHYKGKIERELVDNNFCLGRYCMKTIAGIKNDRNSRVTLEGYRCDNQLAQEFNKFYLRFEIHNLKNVISERKISLCHSGSAPFKEYVLNTLKLEKALVLTIYVAICLSLLQSN